MKNNKMSKPRPLTESEIKSILSFIKPQKGIPVETALSVVKTNRKALKQQLKKQLIYPEQIQKLSDMVEQQYMSTKIQAGESVGVIGAQSIGEKQTQSTLNTFHKAGSGATTGVPRVEELLNATKDPKSVNCVARTLKKHTSIADLRETIGYDVVEITFSKITKSYDIVMNKEPEQWYDAYSIMYGDAYKQFTDCVSLKIDMDILYEYKLDMEKIAEIVSKEYSDMICVFSPNNIGQLDVFVDTSNIDLPENRIEFVNSDNAREIYIEEVVQPILAKIVICGVPGIENIYFSDDVDSFETEGSNFKKLLGLSFIDDTQTVSNDVWDIYRTLGVEATRQFLIEEFLQLCVGINKCHIQLLAEKMTHSGTISSISRYTMRNEECGPMGKASFEETMDNFLKAGVYGQKEATTGVSASIICGKRANIGSGVCEIMMDVKALPNSLRVLHDVKENMSISSFNIPIPPTIDSSKKAEKKLQEPRIILDEDLEKSRYGSDDNTQETSYVRSKPERQVKRLVEDDFVNGKLETKVYFGTTEMNIGSDVNDDGHANEDETLSFVFDSKDPHDVTIRWKNGLKVGKQLFQGYDETHGVYLPLDGPSLEEQGRFMRIMSKPQKVSKKKVVTAMKNKLNRTDSLQQMGYLDF
jgi:hypothetical protein